MTEKINATCSICGRGYYMCLSCKDMMSLNPWKQHTDTSEHYKIYQILRGYSTGVYNQDEAKSKLQMVDLSDLNDLRDNIKELIVNVIGEDKNTVDNVVETETETEVEVENVDLDMVLSEKPKTARRRKSSKVVETE